MALDFESYKSTTDVQTAVQKDIPLGSEADKIKMVMERAGCSLVSKERKIIKYHCKDLSKFPAIGFWEMEFSLDAEFKLKKINVTRT